MIKLAYFVNRIRDVKLKDYLSVFPMTVALIAKSFFKKKYEKAWLICEEAAEARDNGYHFFRYMCQKQPQQKCFYAIKKKSVDYNKVQKLGDVIEYGSIQHWIAYFLCEYNISSQKGGKPNAAMCSFMELNGKFHPHNVFLQHGVTKDNAAWLYADKSYIEKFITSTTPETEYIKSNFGYPNGTIQLTGMPRFDALHRVKIVPNRILIMPTWRYWFNLKSKQHSDTDINFETSEYFQKWMEALDNPKMVKMIKEYNLEVIFYLHRNLQNHINLFKQVSSPIIIASWEKYDIQDLLKTSSMMITDYSSVFFDMVYMKKPVIFYQFDEEKYRKYQYGEGYFDYHDNAFGKSFSSCQDLLSELESIVQNNMLPSEEFLKEHKKIFKYWDNKNSERIYHLLKKEK